MDIRTALVASACTLTVLLAGTACSATTAPSAAARPGAPTAAVTPQARPDATATRASQTLPSADPSDYVLTIRMTAKLPGNDGRLSDGAASDAKLLEVGQHVCTELRSHEPPARVVKELEGAWTRADALVLLGAASGQFSSLCPDQHDTVQAYVQSLL